MSTALNRALAAAALIAAAAVPPLAAARRGGAVEGFDRVRLLPPAGALVEDYENAGYRLRRIGSEVVIEIEAAALDSASRFFVAGRAPGDPVSRLAGSLTAGAGTHYQAVSRVLGWVARSIAYDLDRGQPQDAESVLARRTGYCTGVARLTVALLQAAGIPAREVAGYVVDAGNGSVAGYHRWIEAWLPDRGWVFSDPLRSHHYVPATYVRLASEELKPESGIDGLLLERKNTLTTVDLYPYGAPGITARRNSALRLAATLEIRVAGAKDGSAALTGNSRRRTRPLTDGRTTFLGLAPGRYRLRLTLPGGRVMERAVHLPGRVRRTLSLAAPGSFAGDAGTVPAPDIMRSRQARKIRAVSHPRRETDI